MKGKRVFEITALLTDTKKSRSSIFSWDQGKDQVKNTRFIGMCLTDCSKKKSSEKKKSEMTTEEPGVLKIWDKKDNIHES